MWDLVEMFLPKRAESRDHMGARYIFFTFGTHSWLMKETWTKQVIPSTYYKTDP